MPKTWVGRSENLQAEGKTTSGQEDREYQRLVFTAIGNLFTRAGTGVSKENWALVVKVGRPTITGCQGFRNLISTSRFFGLVNDPRKGIYGHSSICRSRTVYWCELLHLIMQVLRTTLESMASTKLVEDAAASRWLAWQVARFDCYECISEPQFDVFWAFCIARLVFMGRYQSIATAEILFFVTADRMLQCYDVCTWFCPTPRALLGSM